MNQAKAAATLREVEGLRRTTRRRAHPSWIPFGVFGLLVLGAVPFSFIGEGGVDGFYWIVAGPLGGAITWALARRREHVAGIEDPNFRLTAGLIAAMVVGALAVGWIAGDSTFGDAGTLFPIAAGLVAIGAVNRLPVVAGTGIAIAAWGAAVLAVEPNEVAAWAYAGEGAILLAAAALTLRLGRGGGG